MHLNMKGFIQCLFITSFKIDLFHNIIICFIICLGFFFKYYGNFFPRINHLVFFGFTFFSSPKTFQCVSCGVNGHQEVSLSHKQGSHVDPVQE